MQLHGHCKLTLFFFYNEGTFSVESQKGVNSVPVSSKRALAIALQSV